MNTLATVYCCLGGVKMCMAAVEGGKTIEMCFREKPGKHFLQIIQVMVFEKTGASQRLIQDKSFSLPQQVALISTDNPIKCPMFGETFCFYCD